MGGGPSKDELHKEIRDMNKQLLKEEKKNNEEKMKTEREHHKKIIDEKEKAHADKLKMVEDVHKLAMIQKDQMIEVRREGDELLAIAIDHIQLTTQYIAADETSTMLTERSEKIRENICDNRKDCTRLYRMRENETMDADLKELMQEMKEKTEEGRNLSDEMICDLTHDNNIDQHLRESAKDVLYQLQRKQTQLFRRLFDLIMTRAPIIPEDISEIDGFITQMEEIFSRIPSMKGTTTTQRSLKALEEIRRRKADRGNSGRGSEGPHVDDPSTSTNAHE